MESIIEQPRTKDGIKSWVDCMELNFSSSNNEKCKCHYHDYIELLYGLDTDATAWIDGEIYNFVTGDLLIINSNEPHRITHNKDSHYICIKVLPTILYAADDAIFELKYIMPFLDENLHQKLFTDTDFNGFDIHGLITEIMREWYEEKIAYELIIRSDLLRIFAWIFRFWNKYDIMPVSTYTESIKKALTYISENFDTVTAEQVAEYCGFSYNYFSHIFKKEMGKNFKDYIIMLRIREAEKKLISTNDSITDIALSCGFSTSSYFIAKFRQYKNMTPKKFRDIVKGL